MGDVDHLIRDFATTYGFPLDDFQLTGIRGLAEGRSTLVAAPTGAGKTVVGEFAVWQALRQRGKCFYTTPIKALSNQKFSDLSERHGPSQVGLLTGDNAINGDAPIVVMTTEVLRNMLYEGSATLVGLHAVVLDEVHYLADRERGAVWEEVIVQLPPTVQLACLSATVSNAEEFGAWLEQVRDSCDVVISERRPVPLEHHYAINDRIHPVFKAGAKKLGMHDAKAKSEAAKQALAGVPNPDVLVLERRSGARRGRQRSGVRLRPPRRSDITMELNRRRWLPAIYFLFSRKGCDDAVMQLLGDGVRLTTRDETAEIREVAEERTADLPADDLEVLGYSRWITGLEHGIAAHHAGLVPVFKETVEELFVRGLVKVCFATETLALGINMPARTVVIERLEKWSGQRHELLTPGQFTQLTGRAGRRGIDTRGHAVVLYQRDVDFLTVASLVGRRTEPLTSSFAPSYNMAVNLLRRHDRGEAERLLERSFAQFQADRTVSREVELVERNRAALTGYADNLQSDYGDFAEYWALRRELSRLESAGAKQRRQQHADEVVARLAALREGDVVAVPNGSSRPDLVAIVARNTSRAGVPLASAITEDRRLVRLGPREFDRPPILVGRLELPRSGGPRQAAYRKQVAEGLREMQAARADRDTSTTRDAATTEDTAARITDLRRRVREHPVHNDPELQDIVVWAHRHDDLQADTERLQRRIHRHTGSLVRQFARILHVLRRLGYVSGPEDQPTPTEAGLLLAGLYAETDLVLAEVIRHGTFGGLGPADLAAVASVFVHEARGKDLPEPTYPNAVVADRVEQIEDMWAEVAVVEEEAGLMATRPIDAGFTDVAWRWAAGADLDDAIGDQDMTAGDFVRNAKQVADLLRQIRDVAEGEVAEAAHRASRALIRGVVAHTGL